MMRMRIMLLMLLLQGHRVVQVLIGVRGRLRRLGLHLLMQLILLLLQMRVELALQLTLLLLDLRVQLVLLLLLQHLILLLLNLIVQLILLLLVEVLLLENGGVFSGHRSAIRRSTLTFDVTKRPSYFTIFKNLPIPHILVVMRHHRRLRRVSVDDGRRGRSLRRSCGRSRSVRQHLQRVHHRSREAVRVFSAGEVQAVHLP